MNFTEKYQDIIQKAIAEYSFKDQPNELYEPMNYILNLGGKRLRPMMVMIGGSLFSDNLNGLIKPALAIEYFHNFTLMHDDIMDCAPLRRGKETVHTKYNTNVAILSGDALLIKAYQMLEELEPSKFKKITQLFSQTALTICEGQQEDMNFETQAKVSFEEYIEMISHKTGVLCACALKFGALLTEASETDAEHIYEFGKHLGIAFQLMDDYLDLFGNQEMIGKQHAGDIYENKKTILYIFAYQNATTEQKKELDFWFAQKTNNIDKIYGVERIFRTLKVDALTLELIQKHDDWARNHLNQIKVSDEKKKPLLELADYLLSRKK